MVTGECRITVTASVDPDTKIDGEGGGGDLLQVPLKLVMLFMLI